MKIVQRLAKQGKGFVECPYCGFRSEGSLSGHLKRDCEKVKHKIKVLPKDGGGYNRQFDRFIKENNK